MPTSPLLPKELQKAYRSSLTNPPEIKQLLAVMVNSLELDALGFMSSRTIHFYHPPTHLWALFNLFQGFLQDQIRAIFRGQVKTVLLLETLRARIEKQHYRP